MVFVLLILSLFSSYDVHAEEVVEIISNEKTVILYVDGELTSTLQNVVAIEKVNCYSGDLSLKDTSIHFGKRFSRHLYLFLTDEDTVFGIRDNGSIEKEAGTDWESLEEFKMQLRVCL